jgi:hypothetical protein
MNRLKRILRTWLGITESTGYPYRFISTFVYHDTIYAVDGNGDIYVLTMGYSTHAFTVELAQKNPIEKGWQ